MTVQILVATMHQTDYSLLDKMNINSSAVVVNQCDREGREYLEHRGYSVLWIDTQERGLSRSRNMALGHAEADIVLLADDDEIFHDDCLEKLQEAFSSNPSADIIRFAIEGIEEKFKDYPTEAYRLNFLTLLKVSSVEIAFRLASVKDKGLRFDELIGAGTNFPMGEENSFLTHCLRKGLCMHYVPQTIACLHIGDSNWFHGFTENYYIGRGAAYASMGVLYSLFLILQFWLRRCGPAKNTVGRTAALKYMLKGRNAYLKERGTIA